ncbi:MAG TPA: nucleotidyltransferase domain-containing protein [Labilithrix sp.]|nr:nucleotidyltransferase domain-containing protein [Labilithrix sp.]
MNDRIIARLGRVPGLVAAYLFGSRARGTATSSSDVDLAIWLEHAPRSFDDYPFEVAADLEQELGVRVDLVVLNGAPSDLVHRVLRDGELLVEHNRSARVRFEVKARSDYFDMLPIRNEYRRRNGARP